MDHLIQKCPSRSQCHLLHSAKYMPSSAPWRGSGEHRYSGGPTDVRRRKADNDFRGRPSFSPTHYDTICLDLKAARSLAPCFSLSALESSSLQLVVMSLLRQTTEAGGHGSSFCTLNDTIINISSHFSPFLFLSCTTRDARSRAVIMRYYFLAVIETP